MQHWNASTALATAGAFPRPPRATIDFETKSEAGYVWDETKGKWGCLAGAPQNKKGLKVVGASVYAEHPTTDILTLSYSLPGFNRPKRWRPGQPLPQDLFDWIAAGGRVEAHNVMFERLIWFWVAARKYGFPPLPPAQLECSMATARVNCFPGGLGELGDVLHLDTKKDKEGKRLLNKFSIPRNPTKKDPRRWITPADDPEDAENLYGYCDFDVLSEHEASDKMPPMTAAEREFWLEDQEINWRGLGVDREFVRDCIAVMGQAFERYGAEFRAITGLEPTQLEAFKGWLAAKGVGVTSLDADALEDLLERADKLHWRVPGAPAGVFGPMDRQVKRTLEIRALIGSASVKKLFAMDNMAGADNRLRNLIVHHGARTGRPTGEGAQPLNMPKAGPKLVTCASCDRPFKPAHDCCPWCGSPELKRDASGKPTKAWKPEMVDHVKEIMAVRSLDLIEWFFGDALLTISGCARGMFVAGHDEQGRELEFIASDYSAIEAVVTAMLSGEHWRIDVFRENKPIYLMSAAKITGKTVEEYLEYARLNGDHHPDRQNTGKVAELGLGFGGWITAWRQFDDSDLFTDDEVKANIKAWRTASPHVVEMWGGQWRGPPWRGNAERFGFEGAAIDAVQYPDTDVRPAMRDWSSGAMADWRPVDEWPPVVFRYDSARDAMLVTLPSGRQLTYHEPRLEPSSRDYAAPGELSLSYMTWNSNPKYGMMGWVRMATYGGRLTENIVQAVAHDLLRYAILNLRAAGYPTVLHVYDEIVVQIPKGPAMPAGVPDPWIDQVEAIMSTMPPWAAGWPVRAAGGWRGWRYRKG